MRIVRIVHRTNVNKAGIVPHLPESSICLQRRNKLGYTLKLPELPIVTVLILPHSKYSHRLESRSEIENSFSLKIDPRKLSQVSS
jgi:hypothetical protein